MNPNLIVLSHATYLGTSGATAAATYSFMTKGYKPPSHSRSIDSDIVQNQNGKFKYVYDNGPGFKAWAPFSVACESSFRGLLGATAGMQYDRLQEMWRHPGLLTMRTPDGTYGVNWAQSDQDQSFVVFPMQVGDTIEWEVVVQFEEAT